MLAARKSNAETKKISPVLTFPRGLAYKIVTIIKITKMIGLNEGYKKVNSPEFQEAFEKAQDGNVKQEAVDAACAAADNELERADSRAQEAIKATDERIKTIDDVIDSPGLQDFLNRDSEPPVGAAYAKFASEDSSTLPDDEAFIRYVSRDENTHP